MVGRPARPGDVLEVRPCPEARRWIWAALAISLLGVWMAVRSGGNPGLIVVGAVAAAMFGRMTFGMWRCRLVVMADQITITNVWRTHRLSISPTLRLMTRPALGYWTVAPLLGRGPLAVGWTNVTAVVVKDTATGRTYSCEAVRCRPSSDRYPDFLAAIEQFKAFLPEPLPPPPARPSSEAPN